MRLAKLGLVGPMSAVASAAVLHFACGSTDSPSAVTAMDGGGVHSPAPSPEAAAGADAAGPDAAGPGGDAAGTSGDASDAGPSCTMTFPAVSDFGAAGPFKTAKDDATTIASLGPAACTVYRPATLGTGGLLHPVVIWGNGTGTPTEIVYEWLFDQWASHGFIVAAANTPNAGTGAEMLACLAWVEGQNTAAGSPYEGHVAVGRYGASGHSQGGGGAIMTGRDPRIVVTVPFMAYTQGLGYDAGAGSEQHGPMLLMSGGADTIAPPPTNHQPVFEASNVPTFWGTLAGADHVTFALGGEKGYLAPSTAWLRLHLMCDESARPMFYGSSCTLCAEPSWTVQKKAIP